MPLFKPGNIALITQSGSVGSAFVQQAIQEGLGFSIWVNVGNKLDVSTGDLISFMNDDPNVTVVAAYLEDIKNGRRFLQSTRQLKKPVIILKSGRTKAGQLAAQSHTAALAGDDNVLEGVMRQNHVTRVTSTQELYDLTKALSYLPPTVGEHLLIVESSGGLGTLAADIADDIGLNLAPLSETKRKGLRDVLPPFLNPNNPLDMASSFSEPYEEAAGLKVTDDYDSLLVIFGDPVQNASQAVAAFKKVMKKPIVVVFSGGGEIQKLEAPKIQELGVPVFPTVERAMTYYRYCATTGGA